MPNNSPKRRKARRFGLVLRFLQEILIFIRQRLEDTKDRNDQKKKKQKNAGKSGSARQVVLDKIHMIGMAKTKTEKNNKREKEKKNMDVLRTYVKKKSCTLHALTYIPCIHLRVP